MPRAELDETMTCTERSDPRCLTGFIYRMIILVVFLTILLFIFGTVITRKLWWPDLLENFVYVAFCTFFCSIFLQNAYRRISKWPRFLFFFAFMALVVIGVSLGFIAGSFLLEGKWMGNANFILALALGLMSSIGVTFYESQKENLEEKIVSLKDVEVENEQLKRLESAARFNSLQAKLNPHFLFNALNSVAELIHEDPDQAEEGVLRLSDMYRRMLSISQQTFIPVREEIELIEDMLELEKHRFGNRLSYRIDCPESLFDEKIPGLLIEPLVENVIKHASGRSEGRIEVLLRLYSDADELVVEVADDGPGFDPETTGYGYGLYSVQERLRLLYGEKMGIDIESGEDRGTRIRLRFPLQTPIQPGDEAL